jgi:hypothetical protein
VNRKRARAEQQPEHAGLGDGEDAARVKPRTCATLDGQALEAGVGHGDAQRRGVAGAGPDVGADAAGSRAVSVDVGEGVGEDEETAAVAAAGSVE